MVVIKSTCSTWVTLPLWSTLILLSKLTILPSWAWALCEVWPSPSVSVKTVEQPVETLSRDSLSHDLFCFTICSKESRPFSSAWGWTKSGLWVKCFLKTLTPCLSPPKANHRKTSNRFAYLLKCQLFAGVGIWAPLRNMGQSCNFMRLITLT